MAEDNLKNVPLLVFANKQDLQFALDAEEILNTLSLMAIKDRTWTIQACSAVTKEGLQEGMEWLVKTISEKKWTDIYADEWERYPTCAVGR